MKKIYLIVFIFFLLFKTKDIKGYSEFKIGDKVKYNNINFYVIKDSDSSIDSITMIKGSPISNEEIKDLYKSTEINNKISIFNGLVAVPYYSRDNCVSAGDKSGCTIDYSLSDVKQIVDMWSNKYLKESDLKKDLTGYSVRLLTYDELTDELGQYTEIATPSGTTVAIRLNYEWLKSENGSYWTMANYNEYDYYVYSVHNDAGVTEINNKALVRPVVTIKKSSLEKKVIYPEYNVGDTISYKGIDFYVIKASDENQSYVTLLKKVPLTTEEVDKYGAGHVNMYAKDFSDYTLHSSPQYDYIQKAYDQNGYGGIAYYTSETCADKSDNTAILDGCTNAYDKSDIKYVVDAWSDDRLISDDLMIDDLGYKSRLISYEELVNLGFDNFGNTAIESYVRQDIIPNWIFGYQYWTMSSFYDSTDSVWYINDGIEKKNVLNRNGFILGYGTVRPVINLKKVEKNIVIENNSNEEINTVNVPNTMQKLSILFILIGVILISVSIIIVIKNKDSIKNKC